MADNKTPNSYHTFLFPFRWDYHDNAETMAKSNFAVRTDYKQFHKLLNKAKQWDDEEYKLVDSLRYNEYGYFYDFVREGIFDTKRDKEAKNKILNHYTYKLPNDSKYVIRLASDEEYNLDIEDIYLHVFSTGVALLSFHLINFETGKFEDILKINEYGRRIYPQFLGNEKQAFTKATKKSFLADNIEITGIENSKEDFSDFDNSFQHLTPANVFRLPKFIRALLGNKFVTEFEIGKILIKPLVDDRMFVISWFGDTEIINELQTYSSTTKHYNYLDSDEWFKYVFIDKADASCKNKETKREQLKNHTYARWIDEDYESPQLFGITRYSFVALTRASGSFVIDHIKTMYYQMVVLSLMQRASILRFSDEVKEISKFDNNSNQQLQEIKNLNKAYLKFMNQMYFREITAQEQGIELYDILQKHMRIERDVKGLNREIDELYQFARLLEDEKERKQMKLISWIGAILLVPTLIAALFGMNTINNGYLNVCKWPVDSNFLQSLWIIVVLTVFIFAVVFLFHLIIKTFRKHNKSK